MTPRTSGSAMVVAPLVMTTSRATAIADADGSCARTATGAMHAQTTAMAIARELRFDLAFIWRTPGSPSRYLPWRRLNEAHPILPGDDGRRHQADEQPMLDHARDFRKPRREHARLADAHERGIEDEMSAIRDKSMALAGAAQH